VVVGELVEDVVEVGGVPVVMLRGGSGRPLMFLHDELGYPGWMGWNDDLAGDRSFIVPMQPGFGRTPRVEWFRTVRDVAAFYVRFLRESGLGSIDIVGFSAGAWVAAEIAATDPALVDRLVLVAPLGIRPEEGEIFDFLAVTMRRHVAATVSNRDTEELRAIYGGGISPEQFELFEAARAEISRLAWEPFMFDPTLAHRLEGVAGVDSLIVWGDEDQIVPRGVAEAYARALPGSRLEVIPGVGHRPEIEDREQFVEVVSQFLQSPSV